MRTNKRFLFLALVLAIATGASALPRRASITVKTSARYQHIDGFGGTGMNGQWSDNYTEAKVKALWGTDDASVGLNIMRVRINPNEGNWGEYGNAIRWARKYNPNVTVFATPWTPPKKWKTSKSEKYQNEFGTWVWPLVEHSWGGEGSNGGTFNDAYTEQYADFFERYRKTMESKGCPIDMISIQNESDYTPTATDNGVEHASYESCIFSPKQMAAILKATREHVDKKCMVMGPECFGWGQHSYNNLLVTMPDAVNSIDIWGNHIYGINDWSYINTITKKTGKHMWMTEFALDNYKGTWEEEYNMIDNLEQCLKNGFSAYVYYNMLADFFGKGLSGAENETSSTLYKRAYIFSHYAKYATGKDRIGMTISDTNSTPVTGMAFASANGDTVSVFILNRSKYEYNITLTLPDTMAAVKEIVTGASVNRVTRDVTDLYGGMRRPQVHLYPGMLYTFEFYKNEPTEVVDATSKKTGTNVNPINPLWFCGDPTSMEYNGRMYVYGTLDQQQFDYSGGVAANDYSQISQFVMMSSNDMVNWTHHGIIDVKAIAPWITSSRAPSVAVRHNEAAGKDEFYLYFANSTNGIGVLKADSPLGPWTDPLGAALIDKNTEGLGTITSITDPGVAVDSMGVAWLAFGGGKPVSGASAEYPGNARFVQLGADFVSLASEITKIEAPYHLDANELNYMDGKFVYSYCQNSSAKTDASGMRYMVSEDNGATWANKIVFFKALSSYGYPASNNHTHMQKFGTSWYVLYNTQWLENQLGYNGGYRGIAINKSIVSESSGRFSSVTASNTGPGQVTANRPNAFDVMKANTFANAAGMKLTAEGEVYAKNGGWTMVRGVAFGTDGADAVNVNMEGEGIVDVYIDAISEDKLVASVEFSPESNASAEFDSFITGNHHVFFKFRNCKDAKFKGWQFTNSTGIQHIFNDVSNGETLSRLKQGVYTISGQRIADGKWRFANGQLQPGIYVIDGQKVFVK